MKTKEEKKMPKIYVTSYKREMMNRDGEWVDISQFETYKDFVDYCKGIIDSDDIKDIWVQYTENINRYVWNSNTTENLPDEESFERLQKYADMDEETRLAYATFLQYFDNDDNFEEQYMGWYKSGADFAEELYQYDEIVENLPAPFAIDWDAVWRYLYTSSQCIMIDGFIFSKRA